MTPAVGLVERRQLHLLPAPEIRLSSIAVIGGPSSSSPTRPRHGQSQSQSQPPPQLAASSSVDSSAAKRRKRLRLECVEIPVARPDLPRPSSRVLRPTQSAPEIAFGAIGDGLSLDAAKAVFAQTMAKYPALARRVAQWSVEEMARALGL